MEIRDAEQETKRDDLCQCVHIYCRKERKSCRMLHLTINDADITDSREDQGKRTTTNSFFIYLFWCKYVHHNPHLSKELIISTMGLP